MARKGVYAVIADMNATGVELIRIDALPKLCGISPPAVDAELSMLVRHGTVRRLGDRVQLSTMTPPVEEQPPENLKACTKCGQFLPLEMFSRKGPTRRAQCRICCKKAADNPRHHRRRCHICEREFLQPVAELRKVRCGPCELEFSRIPKYGRVQ